MRISDWSSDVCSSDLGHVPSFLKIQDPVVQRVLEGSARAATGIHRIQATYTTSLGFAEFLALMTPFALHLVTCARRFLVRMAAACYLPVLFWAILLTDSRLGVVGYCLSFLFYLFIHGLIKWRRSEEHTSELQSLMRISYAVFG